MSSTRNTDLIYTQAIQPNSIERPSKLMGQVPFIERPSKVSKNSGLTSELTFSESFHREGIPLLVSSVLLRKRNLGQVDLVRLKKDPTGWVVEVGEVKSSEMGIFSMERNQKQRIFSTQNFLAMIFGYRTKLIRLMAE